MTDPRLPASTSCSALGASCVWLLPLCFLISYDIVCCEQREKQQPRVSLSLSFSRERVSIFAHVKSMSAVVLLLLSCCRVGDSERGRERERG